MVDLVLLAPPETHLQNPLMYFPLSLLYLAAVVEKAGYSVEVLDCREGIKEMPKARFYGFSATTLEINLAKQLAKRVKGTTIVGGGHPTLLPEDCINDFDYIVRGEGEDVILDILAGYTRGVLTAPRIRNLDGIPYPAWDKVTEPFSTSLFAGERYGQGENTATLIASRGCPYNCAFCANLFRTPVVFRSAENIIGELRELKDRGVSYFRFEDDNFTLLPQFTDLCLQMKKLDIHWKCHMRSKLLTLDQARLMKFSGCEECGLGVESGDERVLTLNNKQEAVRDHMIAVGMLKEAGVRVKTYLIAGLPGETDLSMKLTQDFMGFAKPDKWTLSTFTPYPGSAIFNNPKKYGVEIIDWDYSNWSNFCKDSFNHVLDGQTLKQMWDRYLTLYEWLREEEWK